MQPRLLGAERESFPARIITVSEKKEIFKGKHILHARRRYFSRGFSANFSPQLPFINRRCLICFFFLLGEPLSFARNEVLKISDKRRAE